MSSTINDPHQLPKRGRTRVESNKERGLNSCNMWTSCMKNPFPFRNNRVKAFKNGQFRHFVLSNNNHISVCLSFKTSSKNCQKCPIVLAEMNLAQSFRKKKCKIDQNLSKIVRDPLWVSERGMHNVWFRYLIFLA